MFGCMLGSVELISNILENHTALEPRLLARPIVLRTTLSDTLIKLYKATLRYIPKAHYHYSRSALSKYYTLKIEPKMSNMNSRTSSCFLRYNS
jgi:hypothetical protein